MQSAKTAICSRCSNTDGRVKNEKLIKRRQPDDPAAAFSLFFFALLPTVRAELTHIFRRNQLNRHDDFAFVAFAG